MKGDFTRSTFDPKKRYTGVRMQQGRVQLDADWNEQLDILEHLRKRALGDVVGPSGVPREAPDSFRVLGGASQPPGAGEAGGTTSALTVNPGRIWAGGILCETETNLSVEFPQGAPVTGHFLVYLDVWQRHVTAIEDPSIRETALGGPDTATRTQTVFQPRVALLAAGVTSCAAAAGWSDPAATDGRLAARFQPGALTADLCEVPADTGYAGLENHLYRVEIHDGGTVGVNPVTFKWSRDNGSVVAPWLGGAGREVTLPTLRLDSVRGFHDAPFFVELADDRDDLAGRAGRMEQVVGHREGPGGETLLQLAEGDPLVPPAAEHHPKVRRWDSGPTAITADGWAALEHGLQVRFRAGTYRSGDYWLIPARAFIGEFAGAIEWPTDGAGQPLDEPPHGVVRRALRLAVVGRSAGQVVAIEDCRRIFSPLVEQVNLQPAGGDGQSGRPGETLPCPLQVAVLNGEQPIAGARVRFSVVTGGGTLNGPTATTVEVQTAADGIASCAWTLPSLFTEGQCLKVTARLLGQAGQEVAAPVTFGAELRVASRIAFTPDPLCTTLEGVGDVQTAINEVCIANGGGRRMLASVNFRGYLDSMGYPIAPIDGALSTINVGFAPKFVWVSGGCEIGEIYRVPEGGVVTGFANLTGGVISQRTSGFRYTTLTLAPWRRYDWVGETDAAVRAEFWDGYYAEAYRLRIYSSTATTLTVQFRRSLLYYYRFTEFNLNAYLAIFG